MSLDARRYERCAPSKSGAGQEIAQTRGRAGTANDVHALRTSEQSSVVATGGRKGASALAILSSVLYSRIPGRASIALVVPSCLEAGRGADRAPASAAITAGSQPAASIRRRARKLKEDPLFDLLA